MTHKNRPGQNDSAAITFVIDDPATPGAVQVPLGQCLFSEESAPRGRPATTIGAALAKPGAVVLAKISPA